MGESSSFIDKRNEAFNEGVYPGHKHEEAFVIVGEDIRNDAFTATQGKTQKDIQRENERTVDDLFKPQDEIGSVFETRDKKLEEKVLSHEKNEVKPTSNNNNNGIDPNDIDALKKLSDQEKGMKEPSVESSLGFIK